MMDAGSSSMSLEKNDPSKSEIPLSEDRKSKRRIVTLPISGKSAPVIPVPQNSSWLDLLFPAHVQNPQRAISCLTSEFTEKTKDVELKLRPDNPSCIPLRTCVQPAVKLILKIHRETKAVRVVGVVRKEIVFNKLADFQLQYPPPLPPPNYRGIVSPLIDFHYITRDKHSIRVNCKSHAHRDVPFDYFYQNYDSVNPRSGEARVRAPRPSLVIHWKCTENEIPTSPMKDLEQNVFKQNYVKEFKEKIDEMFRSRPIWTTSSFANLIQIREVPLRTTLLPHFAFYCNTGPWRGMWIKFGYDPRKNALNRKYQLIDFRAPRVVQAKSVIKRYSYTKSNISKFGKPETTEIESSEQAVTSHIYKADKLPFKRQSHYQVCDIQDNRCQAVLKNYETDVYSHEHGFYTKGALVAVRKVMTEQFRDVLEKVKSAEGGGDVDMAEGV